jgi:hypothetical protein
MPRVLLRGQYFISYWSHPRGAPQQPRWAFVPDILRQEECHPNDRAKLAMLLAYELKAKGL